MGLTFEWDPAKAASNERKHGVTFAEATTVFGDDDAMTCFDPDHSVDESRHITIGRSHGGRLLVIAHTERANRVRVISARTATEREVNQYEEEG